MRGLGSLPGLERSQATGVSADGSVVVGSSSVLIVAGSGGIVAHVVEAFIWDETHGMRSLEDVLVDEVGLDLTGWSLSQATGISDDGLTIVGTGTNPSRLQEGWIAVVPEPSSVSLGAAGLAVAATLASARRRSAAASGAAAATGARSRWLQVVELPWIAEHLQNDE